jgi:membrane dipeptidase
VTERTVDPSPSKGGSDRAVSRAREIYSRALVWDNHACPPFERCEEFLSKLNLFARAGVTVVGLNVADATTDLADLVRMSGRVRSFVSARPESYRMVRNAQDILASLDDGRLGVFLDVEGCYAIGEDLGLISVLFDIGVRWMAMVYNRRNAVGYGVHDETDCGLSDFGLAVCKEMDRVGMIKCCSHTGYRTSLDVMRSSSKPCIFSHSNPRAVWDHPRNIPDELIKACADTDGVVGINGVGIFLGDNDTRAETIAAHISYVARLVGPSHVGIGLDSIFDVETADRELALAADIWPPQYGYRPGVRFAQPEELPRVTECLFHEGFSDTEIEGILGRNLLRVAKEVWPR